MPKFGISALRKFENSRSTTQEVIWLNTFCFGAGNISRMCRKTLTTTSGVDFDKQGSQTNPQVVAIFPEIIELLPK